MNKRVVITSLIIIILGFFSFQRITGFVIYNENGNITVPETFIQNLDVKDAKFYDTNNNGMIDKIEAKNRFVKLKINSHDKERVIIKFRDNHFVVKELQKEEISNLLDNPNIDSISLDSKFNLTLQDTTKILNVSFLHLNNVTGTDSVCILDSGIYRHDDLKSRILNERCFADDGIPGDGIGYCNGAEESDSADDEIGHGTLVAGIVGASGGITGIAPESRFVIVKVCDRNGECSYSDLIKGINYCIDNEEKYNISVLTLSLGTGYVYTDRESCDLDNIEVTNAINNAYSKGIFIDSSSGNSGSNIGISSPACLANVTSVGATTKSDAIASYSNKGVLLDVLAPGSNVNTTSCIGPYALCNPSSYTNRYSGTSFSSPHAAGAALVLKHYAKEKYDYDLNPDEIHDILKESGVRIVYGNTSYPRIDLFRAAKYIDNMMNESLLAWDDLDNTKDFYYYKEYMENIIFYAKPTLKMQVIDTNCTLDLENNNYNLSFNENKSIYEFRKQINNFKEYNFTIVCNDLNVSGALDKEDFDFYLNHSFKFYIKNQLNESLNNASLSVYEFNQTNGYNIIINDGDVISLSEFLVVDSEFVNKTPHRLVLSYGNTTIEKNITLNESMSDLFFFNMTITENISEVAQPSPASGGGGGSSSGAKKEQKYELQETNEEQEQTETASDETRVLEQKEELAQQKVQKRTKVDYNIFLIGLASLFLLVFIKKLIYKRLK
ncbi:S8 family serine peptidase [Candidatus Woesearchaeota archaeon]|nr:S8 family serine peptidase [Candidatus Woesearchaeota archaeon]